MRSGLRNIFIILTCAVLFTSCTGYERVLKSSDVNYKLSRANKYYEQKKYVQANGIYESLLLVMKNTKNYEPLYYRYAYTFYYLKDYLSASYHFKNFVDFFPKSKDQEECEYMHALCLYKESPKYSLDQTYTLKSMGALQVFINNYPDSKRVPEANEILDKCRAKMEKKAAAAARLYYDIGHYKAASVAYTAVLLDYPESQQSDMYQFYIVKAWYNYAKQSIKDKQEERYANALDAYKELVDTYPKSKYLSEAKKYHALADNNIKKIRNEQ